MDCACLVQKWDQRFFLTQLTYLRGGRDSSVGIATRYGLDGLGIVSRWGRDFPHPSRPALGPTQPPVQWVPGLSGWQSGRDVVLTPHPHHQCLGLKKGRATTLPTLRGLVAYKGGILRMRNIWDKSCRETQNRFYVKWRSFRKSCRLRDNV